MDDQNKPRARQKKVVGGGKGVEKKGEGLGTGPLNNTGNYEDRRKQAAQQAARPAQPARPQQSSGFPFGTSRPQQTSRPSAQSTQSGGMPFGTSRPQQTSRPSAQSTQSGGKPFGTSRPQQTSRPSAQSTQSGGMPFGTSRPQQTSRPSAQSTQSGGMPFGTSRPQQTSRPSAQSTQSGGMPFGTSRPQQSSTRPAQSTSTQSTTTRATTGRGGGSKLLLILLAVIVLFGGGKLTGLFGGEEGAQPISQVAGQLSGQSASSGLDIGNLLSAFMGSTGNSSAYDFTGTLSSLLGGGGNTSSANTSSQPLQYFTSSANNLQPDMKVAEGTPDKRTKIKGKGKDQVTVLVYMCGADLESRSGMATADLKEMTKADLGSNVNLIVYTGGASRWKNDVVSSSVNQIYQIRDGGLYRLEENMGNASLTTPATLTKFIQYGKEHFSANRMALIFWDHGGGSLSGFGHDETHSSAGSMTLAGINTALKDAGVTFDFIGFDACLMATVENGLMLSKYADYMIASEESEPGVGWYYTNWLTELGKNPSMPTVQIGKLIADDFVDVCAQQCRGQATTLSVVDLAELSTTVPKELADFGRETNDLIRNNDYNKVSTARSNTREFAQSSRIDQIDLVHFARNLKTAEAGELADALLSAVKYNRTGGGISNANGLSIYFPYKRAANVSKAVTTYSAIGMDDEYTRCIQEFASLEVSGQVATGTDPSSYTVPGGFFGGASGYGSSSAGQSLLNSLLGGEISSAASSFGSTGDLLSGLFGDAGTGSTGSILDFFTGRTLNAEVAAQYIDDHRLDPAALVWQNGKISLSPAQWSLIREVKLNVFYDDGKGYIDLGTDNLYETDGEGNLLAEYDGTWLSIDKQPVAYYYLNTAEDETGDHYAITGYVPALLNDVRVNLILVFDDEHPDGYIAGAQPVYADQKVDVEAKLLIGIGRGDRLQFLCDYYGYDGTYQDSYKLGDPITLGSTAEIANTYIGAENARATYCLTDLYQQNYWTPVVP